MKKIVLLFIVTFFLVNSSSSFADIRPIHLSTDMSIPTPRWMFAEGKDKKRTNNKASVKRLENLKRSQISGKWRQCLNRVGGLYQEARSLTGWLSTVELDCANSLLLKKKINKNEFLRRLRRIERQTSLLIFGGHTSKLRKSIVVSRLNLAEKDIKHSRSRAWQSIDRLLQMKEWLSKTQLAETYRLAGELAFIDQKMEAAKEFILQSLSLIESADLRERLSSVEKAISVIGVGESKTSINRKTKIIATRGNYQTSSKEELELEKRIKKYMNSGELSSAIEDSLKLIKKYPGSSRAVWAKKTILSSYFKLSSNDKSKIYTERQRIIKKMSESDGMRVLFWAEKIFNRQQYKTSYELSKVAYEKLEGTTQSREALNIIALSSMYLGKNTESAERFKELTRKFSGTKESLSGMFYLGLVYLKDKKMSEAVAIFERLINVKGAEDYELSSMYWLWRTLQLQKNKRAEKIQEDLMSKFPLTYYGLRARSEKEESNKLAEELNKKLKKSEEVVEKIAEEKEVFMERKAVKPDVVSLWMTSSQRLSWEKMLLLLKAGWLDEAQKELSLLPTPHLDSGKRILSRFWAATLNYQKSISLARQSVEGDNSQLVERNYVALTFPQEFIKPIEQYSKKFQVSKNLLQGVIRQESAYQLKAVSRANALGLMQLVPPTARDVARQLGEKNLSLPKDLFDISRNIRFGSYYFSKMVKRFNGNVALGLAAYNAGPTRLKRWLKVQGLDRLLLDSQQKPGKNTFKTDDKFADWSKEMWIDKMPWSETRFYVKSILRNCIIYRKLENPDSKISSQCLKM